MIYNNIIFYEKIYVKIYVWCKAKAIEKLLRQNNAIISKIESLVEIQNEIKDRIKNIEKVLDNNKESDDAFIKAIKTYHEHQFF
jgi:dephospho-CoA kinase